MKINEIRKLKKDELKDEIRQIISENKKHSIDYIFKNDELIKVIGVKNKLGEKIISFHTEDNSLNKNNLFAFSFKYYSNVSINTLNKEIEYFYNKSKIKSIDAVILYVLSIPDKNNQTLYHFANETHQKTKTTVSNLKYEFYIESNGKISIWVFGSLFTKKNEPFVLDLDYLNVNSKLSKIYKLNLKYLKEVEPISIIHQEFENEDFDRELLIEKKEKVQNEMMTNKMFDEIMIDLKKSTELNDIGTFVTRMNFLNKVEKQRLFDYLKDNDNEVTKFIIKNNKILVDKEIEIHKLNTQKKLINSILNGEKFKKEKPNFFKRLFSKLDNENYFLKEQLANIEKKEYNYEENVKMILEWEKRFSEIIPESSYREDLVHLINSSSYEMIMLLKSNLNIFTVHLAETLIKNVDSLYSILEKENLNQYKNEIDEEFHVLLLNKFKDMQNLIKLFEEFISIIFEVKTELTEEDRETKIKNIKNNLDKIDLF